MIYYIDAYNLLFHLVGEEPSLDAQREELMEELSLVSLPHSSRFIVVFDSKQKSFFSRHHRHDIEYVFTSHSQNADEYILMSMQEQKNPSCLVTNDRQLLRKASAFSAFFLSVQAFCEKMNIFYCSSQGSPPKKQLRETKESLELLQKIFEAKLRRNKEKS